MSKNKLLATVFTVALAIALIAPAAMAAEVVQGKCVAIDQENKTYTIEVYNKTRDKDNPYGKSTGEALIVNYSKSLIGKHPEVGNILRIAYDVEGTENMALRVMNVTKQDIMKK
jgi:hypothetical protein